MLKAKDKIRGAVFLILLWSGLHFIIPLIIPSPLSVTKVFIFSSCFWGPSLTHGAQHPANSWWYFLCGSDWLSRRSCRWLVQQGKPCFFISRILFAPHTQNSLSSRFHGGFWTWGRLKNDPYFLNIGFSDFLIHKRWG